MKEYNETADVKLTEEQFLEFVAISTDPGFAAAKLVANLKKETTGLSDQGIQERADLINRSPKLAKKSEVHGLTFDEKPVRGDFESEDDFGLALRIFDEDVKRLEKSPTAQYLLSMDIPMSIVMAIVDSRSPSDSDSINQNDVNSIKPSTKFDATDAKGAKLLAEYIPFGNGY